MSQKQHRKQVAKARQKRQQQKYDRRAARNRVIIVVMAALMVLSLIGGALIGLLGSDGDAPAVDPVADEPADDPATDDPASDDPATDDPADAAADDVQASGPCPEPVDPPEITSTVYDEPFEVTVDEDASYTATLVTSCGDIVIDLDVERAPIAVNNLVSLARDGYYDGVVFHRVIDGFVVQVGDPAGTGCGQEVCTAEGFDPDAPTFPGYTFEDELEGAEDVYTDGAYPRGTVAMANAGPDTNGSQFFVTQGDPTPLPGPDYTVLGQVVEGMDVVDDIAASPTDPMDRPTTDVVVLDVVIEES